MADLSIIEFGVYGLIAYTSLLMLIISAIKETPAGKPQSIARSMYMIPGIFCAFLLASAGPVITLENVETTNEITAPSENFTENYVTTTSYTLEQPIWVTLHFLIGIILAVYVILQMVTLFTKV